MKETIISDLKRIVKKGKLDFNVPLGFLTTFKIGGPAEVLVQTPETSELVEILRIISQEQIKLTVLGGGSNIIFNSNGVSGIVLKYTNNRFQINREDPNQLTVKIATGTNVHFLANKFIDLGLSALEYFYGLPGSFGGAVYQNSKWPKEKFAISNLISRVEFLNTSGVKEVYSVSECKFAYGSSIFQEKIGVITEVILKVNPENTDIVRLKSNSTMDYRKKTQPIGVSTAGCVFKNIHESIAKELNLSVLSAGFYIDQLGLKGTKINDLMISEKHANFFVNMGQATSEDYLELVALIKKRVYEKFGVNLIEEVKVIS